MKPVVRSRGLNLAIGAAGSITALAKRLGFQRPRVSMWRQVPANYIISIERATGVPREKLRPDLYRRDASP